MTTPTPEATKQVNFMRLENGPIVSVSDEAFRLVWEPRGYTAVSDEDASDAAHAPDQTAVAVEAPAGQAAPPQPPAGSQQPQAGGQQRGSGGQQTSTP